MNVLVTGNKITGYVSRNGYPGSIHVKDSEVPEGFAEDFAAGKWLYIDGKIKRNPDYVEPEPMPEPEDLEKKVADLEAQNQMLTDCILEMSEIVYGDN